MRTAPPGPPRTRAFGRPKTLHASAVAPTRTAPPGPPRTRAFVSFLRTRQLKKLERAADAAPADGEANMAFVKALAREHPEAALRRIEAMAPATQAALLEPLTREYFKALVATGRIESAPASAIASPGARRFRGDGSRRRRGCLLDSPRMSGRGRARS